MKTKIALIFGITGQDGSLYQKEKKYIEDFVDVKRRSIGASKENEE